MAASVFVRVAEAGTFGRLAPTDICLECVRIFKGQVGRGGRVAAWSSRRPAEDRESVQVASSIKCVESLRKPLQELVDVLYANRVPAMPKAPDRVEFVARRPGGRPSTLLAIRNGLRPRKFRGLRRESLLCFQYSCGASLSWLKKAFRSSVAQSRRAGYAHPGTTKSSRSAIAGDLPQEMLSSV